MSQHIVIIGGGYAGLSTSVLFGKAGYKVTVLEKNSQLGGRAGQVSQDGFRFDTGPSWYLMPEVFEHFYSLLDTDITKELALTRLHPGYKVFFESQQPITIQGNLSDDATTFGSIEKSADIALRRYVTNSKKIYDISLSAILYNPYRSLSWMRRKDILSALPRLMPMAVTPLHRYVSRRFRDTRLQKILEYHCVFLGTSPFRAPAIYSLMSILDFESGVYFPKNGMYSLVENMVSHAKRVGVELQTDTSVSSITTNGSRATGVTLDSGKKSRLILLSRAPIYTIRRQNLPPQAQSFPEKYWQKMQAGPSALLVSLGLRGTLKNLSHHNLYFVDEWQQNFADIYQTQTIPKNPSIYVCNPSKTDPTAAPKGSENIFMLVPLPADTTLEQTQTNRLIDYCIDVLETMTQSKNLKKRIVTQDVTVPQDFDRRFNSWRLNALGGASHILTQSAFFRTPGKSKKLTNLYYAGAGTNPGIGLPMCLISAQIAYKNVHNITSAEPLTRLPSRERT